jgi:hypothetical protein
MVYPPSGNRILLVDGYLLLFAKLAGGPQHIDEAEASSGVLVGVVETERAVAKKWSRRW